MVFQPSIPSIPWQVEPFLAFLDPKMKRPPACTYLSVLLAFNYLYVRLAFVRSFRPLILVFVRCGVLVFVRGKLT